MDRLTLPMLRALEMLAVRSLAVKWMHRERKVRKSTMDALIRRGLVRRRCQRQRMAYIITEAGHAARPEADEVNEQARRNHEATEETDT